MSSLMTSSSSNALHVPSHVTTISTINTNLHNDNKTIDEYSLYLLNTLLEGCRSYQPPPIDTTSLTQGSPEWFKARKSRLTGSNIAAAVGISPYATSHSLYEKITGKLGNNIFTSSSETRHGNHYEDYVVELYQEITKRSVSETGFWIHPTVPWLGASPDGLIEDNGVLEIKCPLHKIHDTVPIYYMPQLQAEMACTQRKYTDFCSWYYGGKSGTSKNKNKSGNELKGRLRIIRVEFSTEYWDWLMNKMIRFWTCVQLDVSPRGVTELSKVSVKDIPVVKEVVLFDVETERPGV